MIEVILDTETTGLSTKEKHKIVEIGCVELENQIPTNNIFHQYINPQRPVSEDAYKVHGYSDKFLADSMNFLTGLRKESSRKLPWHVPDVTGHPGLWPAKPSHGWPWPPA